MMLRFQRNEPSAAALQPRVVDTASTKAWLASFGQLGNPESLAAIGSFLDGLGAAGQGSGDTDLGPDRKCRIADRVRTAITKVLAERSRDGEFGTVPLAEREVALLWPAIETASALRDVYAWLASQLPERPTTIGIDEEEAASAGDSQGSAHNSTLATTRVDALHRALDINAQILALIQRAHIVVPTSLWERHCALGQMVREIDCQDAEVLDPQRASVTSTCRAAFVAPVLIALADPAARSEAEFNAIHAAALRWAGKVGFRIASNPDAVGLPVRPVANPGPSLMLGRHAVRFDTQSLVNALERRLTALADGKTPRELGLSDALGVPATRALLLVLMQRWGPVAPIAIDAPDRAWRSAASEAPLLAVVGMPGKEGAPRNATLGYTTGAYATYDYQRMKEGGITRSREAIDNARIEHLLDSAESWSLVAEAPDALRCVRRHERLGLRLHQLVGVKLGARDSRTPFLLGWTEALQQITLQSEDGSAQPTSNHAVRVRLAPGVPQILRVSADDTEIDCAFLLAPAVAESKKAYPFSQAQAYDPLRSGPDMSASIMVPESGWSAVRAAPRDYRLVLPLATYRPLRVLRAVLDGTAAVLRLEDLLMRGADFDLVRFTPL